jgi:hypothetical protein
MWGGIVRSLRRILPVFCLSLGLILGNALLPLAQVSHGSGTRYFPETGYSVQGDFLAFFDSHGGIETFGSPITAEVEEGGLRVQYFQRVRMELHPGNPLPYRVQLTLLGDLLGYRQPPIPSFAIPAVNHPQRRYYPQSGHTVSYAFLQYFDSHGALDVFGYPITELLLEGGTVVQYFQRAKMEWHPENPISSQITLGNLGVEYLSRNPLRTPTPTVGSVFPNVFDSGGAVGGTGTAVPVIPWPTESIVAPTAAPLPPVTSFDVTTWLKYAITGQGGSQTVYVEVTDERGQGVAGAAIEVVVHFRTGNQIHSADVTDASGYSSLTFGIGYPPPGYNVIVEVRATYAGRTETTRTQFVAWW